MYLFKKGFTEEKRQSRVKNCRVHMANERTFLSWIRTSIGIMAFGFVIEKFMAPVGNHNISNFHSPVEGFNLIAFLGCVSRLIGNSFRPLGNVQVSWNRKKNYIL